MASTTDRDALVALFRSARGASWRKRENWDTDAALSTWFGVEVNVEGRVVRLVLSSNSLQVVLDEAGGNSFYSSLFWIICSLLSGPIPPQLGKLEEAIVCSFGEAGIGGIHPDLDRGKTTDEPISTISPELGKLTALHTLHLNRNQLSGAIPPELGKLAALRWLNLRSNQLSGELLAQAGDFFCFLGNMYHYYAPAGAIPAQLGALTNLNWLDLSYNELDGPVPEALGALSKLKGLNLYNNELSGEQRVGGNEITQPRFVRPIQLAGTVVERAPCGLANNLNMFRLRTSVEGAFPRLAAQGLAARNVIVHTKDNPWKEPPAGVMEKGMAHAAVFLRDLDDYGRAWSNRLKVVLVGLGEAGKTSIATRLEDRLGSSCPKPEERTVGVEIRDIKLGPGPTNEGSGPNVELDVSLWDFAGQRSYYDTHQMFLTPGALFVLVVDMFTYTEGHSREDALEQWLDILQARVPGSVVLLVGTHTDLFKDNSAECTERTDSFKKDVEKIMTRMRCECDSAKARAETELGEGHTTDLKGNPRYQPLRVMLEEDLLALDLTSSDGQGIGLLEHRLEHLAYNGYDGYLFPSVRSVVPEPYLPAIATLEAVRRGADLRGSGRTREAVAQRLGEGGRKKRRSFVRFSEAVSLFAEQQEESMLSRFSNLFRRDDEPRRIFLAAVKSHEAHGAILLTGVDGGGGSQEQHNTGIGAATSAADLIIHVNPSRFADLVRRVVDVRLVDPRQQAKVEEAMEACPSVRPSLLTLTDQHKRFVKAGEVSKDYLKFLWLRDMDLGEASQEAPPLEMSEADVEVMVGSLLDVRFMYRVRDGHHAFVPDRYVVASCLPNKAGPEVDPGKILELKMGSAIYSQKLKLVGAHAVPPGLVPRLLAWCGRGEGRIKACWKRGVCFAFKDHLVLLYEVRATDGSSWIECHARGNVSDEGARTALNDVGDQVDELINDHKYGFPGLGLIRSGESEETVVSSGGDHKALVERIVDVLRDQMNVKFMMDRSMRQDVAFLRWQIPRLVCVLPAPESGAKPLEEKDRSFEQWSVTLRNWCLGGKRMGKGFATQKLRLFFLCPYDRSLAECGPRGQGYEVTELLEWAKKAMPFAKVGLALASIALRVCIGLAIPEVDFEATLGTKAGGALSTFAEELLYSGIESVESFTGERLNGGRAEGLPQGAGAHGAQQVWPSPVQGFTYETLKEVIKSFEVDGMRGRSPFPSFDVKMRLVDRGGRGEEWAWVRTKNIDQFVSA
ncbi:unnamed protein product [Ectocarpus sp. 12 AP-2014]